MATVEPSYAVADELFLSAHQARTAQFEAQEQRMKAMESEIQSSKEQNMEQDDYITALVEQHNALQQIHDALSKRLEVLAGSLVNLEKSGKSVAHPIPEMPTRDRAASPNAPDAPTSPVGPSFKDLHPTSPSIATQPKARAKSSRQIPAKDERSPLSNEEKSLHKNEWNRKGRPTTLDQYARE